MLADLSPQSPLLTIPADEPPSIRDQTPWECRFFDFGRAQFQNIDYFNCGFVNRPDGDWLITRRSLWRPNTRIGLNDLVAFLLDNRIPSKGIKIKIPTTMADEQFEDPRAIYHAGKTWVSACNFVYHGVSWTGAHQILAEVNNDWNTVKRWDPAYGKNGKDINSNTGHEKNWLWFVHDGQLHMLYSAEPHVILRFRWNMTIESEYKTKTDLGWDYGEIRGGTPPVLCDGLLWTFFHSSVRWRNFRQRRYVMGAYAFESKPPFKIVRITKEPLLVGSIRDKWAPGKLPCIFACGSILRNGHWLTTMGVNDIVSAWIEIPHDQLVAKTKAV